MNPPQSPVRLFLSLGFGFGMVLIFLVPPLQVADENAHLKKAYAISTLALLPVARLTDDGVVAGNFFPKALLELEAASVPMIDNVDEHFSYAQLNALIGKRAKREEPLFSPYLTATQSPLLYLPQAFGIAVGRGLYHLLGFPRYYNAATSVYFGRLFNLLFFLAAVALALHWTPACRWTFVVSALWPMTLNLAASLNRDVMPIAAGYLLAALFMRCAFSVTQGSLSRRDLGWLTAVAVVFTLAKQVYLPLLALVAVFPRHCFRQRRHRWLLLAALAAVVVTTFGLHLTLLRLALPPLSDSEAVWVTAQRQYLLDDPLRAVALVLHTLHVNWHYLFVSLVGNLGWMDTPIPDPLLVLAFIMTVAVALFEHDTPLSLPWYVRGVAVGASALIVFAIFIAMYLFWTALPAHEGVGATIVSGVQGRYFLPALPVLLLTLVTPLGARWPQLRRHVLAGVAPWLQVLLTLTCGVVLLRYWVG